MAVPGISTPHRGKALLKLLKSLSAGRWPLLVLVCCLNLQPLVASPIDPATVSVDTRYSHEEIPGNALGLSYETSLMLPDSNGVHYFRPDNKPLIRLFKTLGIRSLRVGGNSVDAASVPTPSPSDIQSFFEFAKAAQVKVIYSVRLENGDPKSAAKIALQIGNHYSDLLACFAIGNEPSYYKDFTIYRTKWLAIHDAIAEADPHASFCGPDQNPEPDLNRKMVQDFGNTSMRLIQITEHIYPFGCAYTNGREQDVSKLTPVDAAASREKMLSPAAYDLYGPPRKGLADAVSGSHVSFRLSETNSYWYSGLAGASDRFAAALWAVDYVHWWISNGADGVNFHTGDRTGGAVSLPCRYSAFVSSPQGYEVRPLGYGLMLFHLGALGRLLSANVSSDPEGSLAAYASLSQGSTVLVTLINKDHGAGAASREVRLKLDVPLASSEAQIIFLSALDNNIAASSPETRLGGASIKPDGSWHGRWTSFRANKNGNSVTVRMPPASAAVIKVSVHRQAAQAGTSGASD